MRRRRQAMPHRNRTYARHGVRDAGDLPICSEREGLAADGRRSLGPGAQSSHWSVFWRPLMTQTPRMETFAIPGTSLTPSRIGLGTWAIGGWMWGGTDEAESIRTIHAALDRGITLIDTAPVYGFGHSEEIVGKALAEGGRRAGVVLATKAAIDWKDEKPFRNGSRTRIMK